MQTVQIGRQSVSLGSSIGSPVPSNADVLLFDPPWDVGATIPEHEWRHVIAFCDPHRMGDIVRMMGPPTSMFVWDCVSSWFVHGRPLKRCKLALWYGQLSDWDSDRARLDRPQKAVETSNTRGAYVAEAKEWTQLSDVYRLPITSAGLGTHEKPLEWVRAMIGGCCGPDAVVYDPFAGHGAFAEACQQLGLESHHVELDEARFDAICTRLDGIGRAPVVIRGRSHQLALL